MKASSATSIFLFLTLILLAAAAPPPIYLDTTTHSVNPSHGLRTRNGTCCVAGYRQIWLYCKIDDRVTKPDEKLWYCGNSDAATDAASWLTPTQCTRICNCDCNKHIRCKGFNFCNQIISYLTCVTGIRESFGCSCIELGLKSPTPAPHDPNMPIICQTPPENKVL